MDFKDFLNCELDKEYVRYEYKIKASEAKQLYDEWAEENDGKELSVKEFGTLLGWHFPRKRYSDGVYYLGVKESNPEPYIDPRFDFI